MPRKIIQIAIAPDAFIDDLDRRHPPTIWGLANDGTLWRIAYDRSDRNNPQPYWLLIPADHPNHPDLD